MLQVLDSLDQAGYGLSNRMTAGLKFQKLKIEMEEAHPFKRSNIEHFPRFSKIFDDAGADEEEENEMEMSSEH